jgi:hypothetical protein
MHATHDKRSSSSVYLVFYQLGCGCFIRQGYFRDPTSQSIQIALHQQLALWGSYAHCHYICKPRPIQCSPGSSIEICGVAYGKPLKLAVPLK